MKIILKLETGNDAFQDGEAVGRLLMRVAADLRTWGNLETLRGHSQPLRDSNGNTVGRLDVKP